MSSIPLGSYTLSTPSSAGFPELQKEKCNGDILFRAGCAKVSHSLFNITSGLCVCFYVQQEEDSLMVYVSLFN